jgi:hypothetical protein
LLFLIEALSGAFGTLVGLFSVVVVVVFFDIYCICVHFFFMMTAASSGVTYILDAISDGFDKIRDSEWCLLVFPLFFCAQHSCYIHRALLISILLDILLLYCLIGSVKENTKKLHDWISKNPPLYLVNKYCENTKKISHNILSSVFNIIVNNIIYILVLIFPILFYDILVLFFPILFYEGVINLFFGVGVLVSFSLGIYIVTAFVIFFIGAVVGDALGQLDGTPGIERTDPAIAN